MEIYTCNKSNTADLQVEFLILAMNFDLIIYDDFDSK